MLPSGRRPRPVADDVLDYLKSHREAEDTVEGIVSWWLPMQHLEHAAASVEAALQDLVARDLVVVRRGADGRLRYRLNPQHTRERRRPRK